MDIKEGFETLKGRPVDIPNASRNDLPKFLKQMGAKTIVEIGVYRGEYTEILAKSGLQVFGVDPWLAYNDYPYLNKPEFQKDYDSNYEITKKRLENYGNVELIKADSVEALKYFDDGSLDAVYIDGNHSFKYVAMDICNWINKVKPGGFICGHDYFYGKPDKFHVRYVVDAFVESHAIQNLWILGEKKPKPGEHRDTWRSWMFQKPYGNYGEK